MKLHKTQEVAQDILKIFDKQKLQPEAAFMVIALVLQSVGQTVKADPIQTMKVLHAALIRLAETTKDQKIQDVLNIVH